MKTHTETLPPDAESSESERRTRRLLKIFLMVGQPDVGKSFMSHIIADRGQLVARKDVLLCDNEEGTNLVFTRLAPTRIHPIKLYSETDVNDLITRMEEKGYDYAFVDTKGSSLVAVRRACGNFDDLTDCQVQVVACIVVGTRENSEVVGHDWLDILKPLEKIYWIWNDQKFDEDHPSKQDNRQLPENLPCDRSKIQEIRIPPLQNIYSREIITLGVPFSRVVAGLVPESQILSHRTAKVKISRWLEVTHKALEPIIAELNGSPA